MDAKPRAGFECQHGRQSSGAPAGPGAAAVSWCMHASPGRHSASLTLVLSEKSESTHCRSDILNSISSPCVASGHAHIWSRRTLNICCSYCQQRPVLVCRQPVNAFPFNLAKRDKSLSLARYIKQALEIITGLLYGRSCKANIQGFSSVHQTGWHLKWRKKRDREKQDGATPRGKWRSFTGRITATDGVVFPGSGNHPGQVVLGIVCCPLRINFFS